MHTHHTHTHTHIHRPYCTTRECCSSGQMMMEHILSWEGFFSGRFVACTYVYTYVNTQIPSMQACMYLTTRSQLEVLQCTLFIVSLTTLRKQWHNFFVHKHVHVRVHSKTTSYMYVHTCHKFSMEVNEGLWEQPYWGIKIRGAGVGERGGEMKSLT